MGTAVLGCSPDKPETQKKFEGKCNLKVPLLSDPNHKVAEAYGAWGDKTLYGRKFKGIIRSTFLIDEKGNIAADWTNVRVDGHAEALLEAAKR